MEGTRTKDGNFYNGKSGNIPPPKKNIEKQQSKLVEASHVYVAVTRTLRVVSDPLSQGPLR